VIIKIPLFWWSKEVYDICYDEFRGGWRFLGIGLHLNRNHRPGLNAGFTFRFECGLCTRFPPMVMKA